MNDLGELVASNGILLSSDRLFTSMTYYLNLYLHMSPHKILFILTLIEINFSKKNFLYFLNLFKAGKEQGRNVENEYR